MMELEYVVYNGHEFGKAACTTLTAYFGKPRKLYKTLVSSNLAVCLSFTSKRYVFYDSELL